MHKLQQNSTVPVYKTIQTSLAAAVMDLKMHTMVFPCFFGPFSINSILEHIRTDCNFGYSLNKLDLDFHGAKVQGDLGLGFDPGASC